MLKIGKMQVNSRVSPQVFFILIIFSFILFLIFGVYTIKTFTETKDYVKIDAIITEVGYHYYYESDSYSNYIKLKYDYNNETYESEQRVSFKINKKAGDNMKIYIDPENPVNVRDNYLIRISLIISIITIAFNIFCIKAYKLRKNSN